MKIKNNRFKAFAIKHQKYGPLIFFIGGFIWDTLTLGRIDRLYDRVLLCTHLTSLSICIFLYNLADDGKWEKTIIGRYEKYFPLAIQFFLGALASAYVIYFSRSVSLSKTASFFIILLLLLFANELLKQRLSNKYLQFCAYFFVNFTFFSFFIPVVIKQMNTWVFILSGGISLLTTSALIIYIYLISPSTRNEIKLDKMFALMIGIYLMINAFYYFNLIPPVPMALKAGLVAHNIEKVNGNYIVTYEREEWYKFWRENKKEYTFVPGEEVFVFSSIFAPYDLKKRVIHRWKWFSPHTDQWEIIEDIGFKITGGRTEGFRGYSYKSNMMEGEWEVEVITEEELVLGVIDFDIAIDSVVQTKKLIRTVF